MSVLFAAPELDAAVWRARLEALLPSHAVAILGEPFDRAAIRYALSWAHPPGALADLPNLKAIFSLGAGVDHLFADPALPDRPIVRVVDSDLRDRMSEWVVMHALIHLRQLRRYERQQRDRVWADDDAQPKAGDIRVSVLGLGVLGLDAATKLKALGFKVSAWSATPKSTPGIECFNGKGGLDALLAQTDLLVVLLPLTPATQGMLNASLIAKLKQGGRLGGPVLINAGRGGLQVEADILAALDFGRPQRRLARRVRTRAAPGLLARLEPPSRLREPPQRRHLHSRRRRLGHRPPDRGVRARRAAAACRGSEARVLRLKRPLSFPRKAGIQTVGSGRSVFWMPAFAGMIKKATAAPAPRPSSRPALLLRSSSAARGPAGRRPWALGGASA